MADSVKVEPSTRDFAYWMSRPFVDAALRPSLATANVLIVPQEATGHYEGPVFPVGTEQLFHLFRRRAQDGFRPDICIADKDYKEHARHADWIWLPTVVVTCVALPLALNVLGNYVYDRLKRKPQGTPTTVKSTLIVVTEGRDRTETIEVTYEGPAAAFPKVVDEVLRHREDHT